MNRPTSRNPLFPPTPRQQRILLLGALFLGAGAWPLPISRLFLVLISPWLMGLMIMLFGKEGPISNWFGAVVNSLVYPLALIAYNGTVLRRWMNSGWVPNPLVFTMVNLLLLACCIHGPLSVAASLPRLRVPQHGPPDAVHSGKDGAIRRTGALLRHAALETGKSLGGSAQENLVGLRQGEAGSPSRRNGWISPRGGGKGRCLVRPRRRTATSGSIKRARCSAPRGCQIGSGHSLQSSGASRSVILRTEVEVSLAPAGSIS